MLSAMRQLTFPRACALTASFSLALPSAGPLPFPEGWIGMPPKAVAGPFPLGCSCVAPKAEGTCREAALPNWLAPGEVSPKDKGWGVLLGVFEGSGGLSGAAAAGVDAEGNADSCDLEPGNPDSCRLGWAEPKPNSPDPCLLAGAEPTPTVAE